jgi:hypothetical protein
LVVKKPRFRNRVDPDVDRLAFICEDGEMFGNTLCGLRRLCIE